MHYPYTDNDNLASPLTYQYSQYLGADFIVAWRDERRKVLASASVPSLPSLSLADHTASLLIPAVKLLRNGQLLSDEFLLWPVRLLKKFEVTKRLYSHYNSQVPFRRQSDDFNGLHNYFLLAEICYRQWLFQRHSYWLSCALKLTDTLCSQRQKMTATELSQLAWIVTLELDVINSMLEEKGICC